LTNVEILATNNTRNLRKFQDISKRYVGEEYVAERVMRIAE